MHPPDVPLWAAIPFAFLLLNIALLPLMAGHWWERNLYKTIVVLLISLPVVGYLIWHGEDAQWTLLHELEDYGSFIVLLTALYVISGGIALRGDLPAYPITNVGFLGAGAVLANCIGTTGASMLLIRPLLRTNSQRKRTQHVPIFFVFIVCNTGGLLTPLGDPPLFLGFLQGVEFSWTMRLLPQWLMANALLLLIFLIWDSWAYSREAPRDIYIDRTQVEPLSVTGWKLNGLLLIGVIAAVIAQKYVPRPCGELAMVALLLLSLKFTAKEVRAANRFAWGPILEVAILFLGIFVTMVPALAYLKLHGHEFGITEPWQYFWITGGLSSVLDNAPTYLTLGTLASQGETLGWLSLYRPELLAAISCGAVFMGANTYIGNGPNFMVKAIADESGCRMPSFFGYMFFSGVILLPIFGIITLFFFR